MPAFKSRAIWFAALPLALGSVVAGAPAQAQTAGFVKERAANLPGFNIYRPADLKTRRAAAPVIVWANGGCVKSDFTWSTLFERWAGAGYVVITISDPAMEAQAAQRRAAPQGATPAPPAPPPQPAAPPPGAAPAMAQVSAVAGSAVADQAKAIDWAEKENATKGSPYAGKLDTSRVVTAGNSCGGISSLTLASRDKRPKSVFVLSGSSVGPAAKREPVAAVMNKVNVPSIWVVGGPQDVARPAAAMDYDNLPAGVRAVVVERSSFDHRTVSTDPATLRDVAEMGLAWFRASLYGDRAAIATVTTKGCAQCDGKTWTVRAKNF